MRVTPQARGEARRAGLQRDARAVDRVGDCAVEAREAGFVNEVVAAGHAFIEAQKVAREISELPPEAVASAVAVLFVLFAAVMLTSAVVPVSVTVAPDWICAWLVLLRTRSRASEPATPTLPPLLAPDIATAPKWLVPLGAPGVPAV